MWVCPPCVESCGDVEFLSVHGILQTEKLHRLSPGTDSNVGKFFLLLFPIVGMGEEATHLVGRIFTGR